MTSAVSLLQQANRSLDEAMRHLRDYSRTAKDTVLPIESIIGALDVAKYAVYMESEDAHNEGRA